MRYRNGVQEADLNAELLRMLRTAEVNGGTELVITSGFRENDSRCHGEGKAVDIACVSSEHRMTVAVALLGAGFERIGLYSAHVHADICETDHASKVLWLGGASK